MEASSNSPFLTYFSEIIQRSSEHLNQLAGYLKIKPESHPLIILNAKKQEKYVLTVENAEDEVTTESVLEFIADWSEGSLTKYGLTDEIKVVEEKKEEEDVGEL